MKFVGKSTEMLWPFRTHRHTFCSCDP